MSDSGLNKLQVAAACKFPADNPAPFNGGQKAGPAADDHSA